MSDDNPVEVLAGRHVEDGRPSRGVRDGTAAWSQRAALGSSHVQRVQAATSSRPVHVQPARATHLVDRHVVSCSRSTTSSSSSSRRLRPTCHIHLQLAIYRCRTCLRQVENQVCDLDSLMEFSQSRSQTSSRTSSRARPRAS